MGKRWTDVLVSRLDYYTLGWDNVIERHYLAIPVGNQMADYDEYYMLSAAEFEALRDDPAAARAFADRCRRREMDERLILKPGRDRGHPWQPR